MKKILTFGIMLLFLVQIVSAQTDEVSAGVTPDNPLWGLEIAFEKISLVLTFNERDKNLMRIGFAEERLAEIEELKKKGKTEKIVFAQNEYGKTISEIKEDKIDNDVMARLEKHIIVLERVIEKSKTNLSIDTGLSNALQSSSKVLENIKGKSINQGVNLR